MHFEVNSLPESRASQLPWYALYTRHQHEKMVAKILAAKGLETFLPLHTAAHHWKDRTKVISVPLFPCYVFLTAALEHRHLQIVTTPGVYGLVLSAGQPAVIPVVEMEAIRRVVESGARLEPHPFLKCGDRVRIKSGPLVGIQGILVRKKNMCRLVLSVEMLGKAAAMEVDAFQVEPVNVTRLSDRSIEHSSQSSARMRDLQGRMP
jgi:transcription antitermination factor NusG